MIDDRLAFLERELERIERESDSVQDVSKDFEKLHDLFKQYRKYDQEYFIKTGYKFSQRREHI